MLIQLVRSEKKPCLACDMMLTKRRVESNPDAASSSGYRSGNAPDV